jgi:hypothetical protein
VPLFLASRRTQFVRPASELDPVYGQDETQHSHMRHGRVCTVAFNRLQQTGSRPLKLAQASPTMRGIDEPDEQTRCPWNNAAPQLRRSGYHVCPGGGNDAIVLALCRDIRLVSTLATGSNAALRWKEWGRRCHGADVLVLFRGPVRYRTDFLSRLRASL